MYFFQIPVGRFYTTVIYTVLACIVWHNPPLECQRLRLKLSLLVSDLLIYYLSWLQANAQQKFMRIKHAYNTLLKSDSQKKYGSGNQTSDYSYSAAGADRRSKDEEDFYGLGTTIFCFTLFLSRTVYHAQALSTLILVIVRPLR